jgi:hypothetical protein
MTARLTHPHAAARVPATLLRRVVETYTPLAVWLFGSRAEGRARPDSDWDLLVIVPDGAPARLFDPVLAFRVQRGSGCYADIIACERSVFDEEKDEIDTLAREAWRSGMLVYELPKGLAFSERWPARCSGLMIDSKSIYP